MYESFYGLKEKPFSLLPDPTFLYKSKKHSMALTMLEYGLMNQAGITVITGEVGSGKTTLIREMLNQLEDGTVVGLISNTHKSFGELLQRVLLAFNLDYEGREKVALYHIFEKFVVNTYAQGQKTVLIIDEAQNLAPETLEELRMLSNINADKDQVLQLVLVGQPELRSTLRRSVLRQFSQRVTSSYHLDELDQDETRQYIQHRIKVAGCDIQLFEDAACDLIWKYSQGIPRVINTICDTALVYGYADEKHSINADLVIEVVRERQRNGFYSVVIEGDSGNVKNVPGAEKTPASEEHTLKSGSMDSVKEFTKKTAPIVKEPVRVAIASDSKSHQEYFKGILEANQVNVTAIMPISERFLGHVDKACADVLLVDLDESMEMVPGHLEYLFDNLLADCQVPILFNDGSMLQAELQTNAASLHDDYGKKLASKLKGLIESESAA